jgi:hypothetical protein
MRKNKILLSVTIIIIFASLFIAWVYVGMNGLPWKIKQTEVTAGKYLEEKYPDLKYKVDKPYYNSKFGYYACNFITKGDLPITFQVIVYKKTIEDDYYEMKVNAEAKNMVLDLIKNNTPNIKYLSVLSDAGNGATKASYEKYTSFIPGSAHPLKIDITWNGDKMSLDSFIDKTISIREVLEHKKISVCGLYIQDATNEYVINLNGGIVNGKIEGNYNLTKDEIIKSKTAYKMK